MKRRSSTMMILTSVAIVAAATLAVGKKTPSIPFDHKKHVDDQGIACEDCHAGAIASTTSGDLLIPKLEDCYVCHDQAEVKWQPPEDGSSPWPSPPRELVFNHEKHAALGIECLTCHADVPKSKQAPSHGIPEMALCTDCHAERAVNDDCGQCHSQVQFLRPKDHGADWVLDHRSHARGDARTCETCHQQSYCSSCHEGAALVLAIENKADAPIDRIGPMASAHEGKELLVLQRAHTLNYRYTHGSDVRAKTVDCAACHETQTFCNACHNPETDPNRFRPVWHDVANFEMHTHAEYARRDIETCAGCHDQSGGEPSCLRCHKSIVSPHPPSFMRDVKGQWHDDNNAVCFVCHDNGSRTSGVGFCGKCHG